METSNLNKYIFNFQLAGFLYRDCIKLLASGGFLFIILSIFSCKKFVNVSPPKTELVTETVYNNATTATAALTAIYAKIVDDNLPYNIPFYTGLFGDEQYNYSTNTITTAYYQNNLNSVNAVPDTWFLAYRLIYQSNSVWEGCSQSTKLDNRIKKQLMAEARFIRAYLFFYLVNLYGDAPLTLSTNYVANGKMARTSKDQVYDQIIADLKEAQSNLNEDYIDNSDTTITNERVRPNKFTATALLARVYLYKGKYLEAESEASFVINKTSMYDTVSFSSPIKLFDKNSKEAIWQIPPSATTTYNTQEGRNFILTEWPASSTLSSQLLNAFEPGDKRKSNWTNILTIGSDSFVYPFKYKVQTSSVITEYSMALRLAEQYLIRAEARAQQGKITEAQADLNVIRRRAGLSSTTAVTKEALLDAILQERRVELFTEWGHRWFDLKRTGKVGEVMQAIAPSKAATWVAYKQYWPIPQTDITNNPQLVQTEGYN